MTVGVQHDPFTQTLATSYGKTIMTRLPALRTRLADVLKGLLRSRLFAVGALVFSIGYFLIFVFFGLDFTDSFFHLNSTIHPTDSPLSLLTALIGHVIRTSLGTTLVCFRLANRFAYLLAAAIPYLLLVRHRTAASSVLSAAATVLILNVINSGHYGYTNVTIVLLSLSVTLLIGYFQTLQLSRLALFGVASSAVVLARFPNIIVVPISLFLMTAAVYLDGRRTGNLCQSHKVCLVHLGVYVCALGMPLALVAMCSYGSLSEYWKRLAEGLLQAHRNGYAPKVLVGRYLLDVLRIFQYIGVLVLLAYSGPGASRLPTLLRTSYRSVIGAVFVVLVYYGFCHDPYAYGFSLFISAVICLLLWHAVVSKGREHAWLAGLAMLSVPAFALIPAMGSDTGLLKLALLLVVFLPWVVEQCDGKMGNEWFIGYMAVLVLVTIPLKAVSIYEDAPVRNLTQTTGARSLAGIRTTPARAGFVDEVLAAYGEERRRNRTVMFFGRVAHLFNYLSNEEPLYAASFRMPPDEDFEVRQAEVVVGKVRPVVFFLPEYPGAGGERERTTAFERMLARHEYEREPMNGFVVYRPREPAQGQSE